MNNKLYSNVWCEWTLSGFITFKSDEKIKTFCDTRIEIFDKNILSLGRVNPDTILGYVDILKGYKTDYLILPITMKNTLEKYDKLNSVFEGKNFILVKI